MQPDVKNILAWFQNFAFFETRANHTRATQMKGRRDNHGQYFQSENRKSTMPSKHTHTLFQHYSRLLALQRQEQRTLAWSLFPSTPTHTKDQKNEIPCTKEDIAKQPFLQTQVPCLPPLSTGSRPLGQHSHVDNTGWDSEIDRLMPLIKLATNESNGVRVACFCLRSATIQWRQSVNFTVPSCMPHSRINASVNNHCRDCTAVHHQLAPGVTSSPEIRQCTVIVWSAISMHRLQLRVIQMWYKRARLIDPTSVQSQTGFDCSIRWISSTALSLVLLKIWLQGMTQITTEDKAGTRRSWRGWGQTWQDNT